MRNVTINEVIREFNRYSLDAALKDELSILGIGPDRRFKQEQLRELYKPLFLALWVHALDMYHKEVSDRVRDSYLRGLKACFCKHREEYERTVNLVIEYEVMLGDFSDESFRFTAEQIVKKIARNKNALPQRAGQLGQKMRERLHVFETMLRDVSISPDT